jgi:hypothetical protein
MHLPTVSALLRRERQLDMLRLYDLEVEREIATSANRIARLTTAIDSLNQHIFDLNIVVKDN